MQITLNTEDRKPVWKALSELYLDTERQSQDMEYLARILLKSPYSWSEIRRIDQLEVFPVLWPNLLHIAGNWTGFEEDWLEERILRSLNGRSAWKEWWLDIEYRAISWLQKDDWAKLEQSYVTLRQRR